MMRLFTLALCFISVTSYAKSDKNVVSRNPATQGDFSECRGVLGADDAAINIFTQSLNFSDVRSGQEVEVLGSISSGSVTSNSGMIKIGKAFTVPGMAAVPKKGSGWNDLILSTSFVSGSLVIEKKAAQEVLLACENHNRSRY